MGNTEDILDEGFNFIDDIPLIYERPAPEFFIEKGVYFGFPDCCILDFLSRTDSTTITDEQRSVLDGHGFIPCPECTQRIISGEVKIHELIKDRICPTSYPDDGR